MGTLRFSYSLTHDTWKTALPDIENICQVALDAVADDVELSGEVALLFTDNATMQQLNSNFRGKDKPTDVLSFESPSADPAWSDTLEEGATHLGDIAFGYEISAHDAAQQNKSMRQHISHLLIHAVLHLDGMDHEIESDALKMEAKERKALAILGYPDPYSDTYTAK